ncbi:hypothetical protein [Levilactobacillus sp. N40-8-2]|uniref:hypothetical protein n=1 Tax=Levilactobacillus muriae TaxID=3238987 RepID=UPI0038B2526A
MNHDHIIYQASITPQGDPQITFTPDTPDYANVAVFRNLLMLTMQASQDVLHLSDNQFSKLMNDALAEAQERRQENLLTPQDTLKLITKNLTTNKREEFTIPLSDLQDLSNDDDALTITTSKFSFSFIDNEAYKQIKKNVPADAIAQIPEALGIDHVLYAYKSNHEGVGQLIQYAQAHNLYTEITRDDDDEVPDTPEEFDKFMEQEFGYLRDGNDDQPRKPSNIIPFPKR